MEKSTHDAVDQETFSLMGTFPTGWGIEVSGWVGVRFRVWVRVTG